MLIWVFSRGKPHLVLSFDGCRFEVKFIFIDSIFPREPSKLRLENAKLAIKIKVTMVNN